MAVAHDASSKFGAPTSNVASFSWTHTPVGTPRGVIVFVQTAADADYITSVTYGGTAMTQVAEAIDTVGEPMRETAFFLGAAIPTGAQSVVVTRTSNGTGMNGYCATVTADGDTATGTAVLLQEDGAYAEVNVDDGSPGTNSLRYAGLNAGGVIPTAGANSTLLQSQAAFGGRTSAFLRETTAGQGSRPVGGVNASSDDRAAVHIAVFERTAAITGTATASITEADVVAGGKTIIITLTGDTWVAAGATFDAQRQNIINGLDSAQSEALGWDAKVKALEVVSAVVRTSATVVTVTLTASATYDITAQETITVTVPATAVVAALAIVGAPTFTVAIASVNATATATSTMPKLTSAAVGKQAQSAAGASTLAKLTSAAVAKHVAAAAAASTVPKLTSAAVALTKQVAAAASTLAKLTSAAAGIVHPRAEAASTVPRLTSLADAKQGQAAAGASAMPRLTSAAVAVMQPKAEAASTMPRLTSLAAASLPFLAAAASTVPKLTSAAGAVMHPKAAAASTIAMLTSAAVAVMHPKAAAASTLAKLTSAASVVFVIRGPGRPGHGTALLTGPPTRGSGFMSTLGKGTGRLAGPPTRGSTISGILLRGKAVGGGSVPAGTAREN